MPTRKLCWYIAVFFSSIALFSCENDIEVVKLWNPEKAPDITLTNVETLYSDSAKLKVRMIAPVLNRYDSNKKKYSEFPKGMHVFFYNDSFTVNAEISSKYAIYDDRTELWEAKNDVMVMNTKGEKLNTEQLFWDQQKRIIYTKKYCRITMPDGLQNIGENGMEAQENFENWKLFGATGTVNVKNATE